VKLSLNRKKGSSKSITTGVLSDGILSLFGVLLGGLKLMLIKNLVLFKYQTE